MSCDPSNSNSSLTIGRQTFLYHLASMLFSAFASLSEIESSNLPLTSMGLCHPRSLKYQPLIYRVSSNSSTTIDPSRGKSIPRCGHFFVVENVIDSSDISILIILLCNVAIIHIKIFLPHFFKGCIADMQSQKV